jgi:hypothetical protein
MRLCENKRSLRSPFGIFYCNTCPIGVVRQERERERERALEEERSHTKN